MSGPHVKVIVPFRGGEHVSLSADNEQRWRFRIGGRIEDVGYCSWPEATRRARDIAADRKLASATVILEGEN